MKKTVAICYDFDLTLSPRYMYEYKLLPDLGYQTLHEISPEIRKKVHEQGMIYPQACFHTLFEIAKEKGIELSPNYINECGAAIQFFQGLDTWFTRINDCANNLGIIIEHYVTSLGSQEMVKASSLNHFFHDIYGSRLLYKEYPNEKNFFDGDDKNDFIDLIIKKNPNIEKSNILVIGDGETDIPCMEYIVKNGGESIIIYDTSSPTAKDEAQALQSEQGVKYIVPADYRQNSLLETTTKNFLLKRA